MRFAAYSLLLSLGVLLAARPAALAEKPVLVNDWVPLKTEIPKAVYSSVKGGAKLPNLEPVELKQPPLLVPPRLTNVARGKTVTSSDPMPMRGELSCVTDGNKESTNSSYVEIHPGKQWVQIDLGSEKEIFGIWLWHVHRHRRAYIDVVVWLSNEPDFVNEVVTVYNADHDNSSGLGKGRDKAYVETNRGRVIDGKGTRARYVRLHSNGNTSNAWNQYVEVEVWGRTPEEH